MTGSVRIHVEVDVLNNTTRLRQHDEGMRKKEQSFEHFGRVSPSRNDPSRQSHVNDEAATCENISYIKTSLVCKVRDWSFHTRYQVECWSIARKKNLNFPAVWTRPQRFCDQACYSRKRAVLQNVLKHKKWLSTWMVWWKIFKPRKSAFTK